MCLIKVYEVYKEPLTEIKTGYKFFIRDKYGVLRFWYTDAYGIPKIHGWNEDFNTFKLKSACDVYPTGYHIFNKLDAISNEYRHETYKVEYTDIIVDGMNIGIGKQKQYEAYRCFVAKKFRILGKV